MQLDDAINSFLAKISYLSPGAIKQYHYVLRNFRMFMESRWNEEGVFEGSIALITKVDLELFLHSQVEPIKASTYNSYLSVLGRLFNYLMEMGYLSISPSRNIRRRKERRLTPSFLTEDEQSSLLKMALSSKRNGFRDFLMIYLILNTGRRLSDILAVNATDICLNEEGVILSIKGMKFPLWGSVEGFQTRLKNYLDECRSQCKHEEFVPLFCSMSGPKKGQRMNPEAAQDQISIIFRKCNLNGRAIQCLRQTALGNMFDIGLGPHEIMYLLGNNSILSVSCKLFEYQHWNRAKK